MLSTDFTDRIKAIAAEKDFGREMDHIRRVCHASSAIYSGLSRHGIITGSVRDMELLKAICFLHDVGVKVENGELGTVIDDEDDHNLRSFKWCVKRLGMADCAGLLTIPERTVVEYCTLWHKGNAWAIRPEAELDGDCLVTARLLGGILRVGDSLASSFGKKKPAIGDPEISVSAEDGELIIGVRPCNAGELQDSDLDKANKRKDLLLAALGAAAFPRINGVTIKLV